jgi:hypothetical protein
MRKTAVRLLAGVLFSCLAVYALAQSQNPLLDWRTLDTEHFHIHFTAPQVSNARVAAAIAESQYARLTKAFDWHPAHKIHIRLVDNSDRPQGVANVIPYTQAEILLVPPDEGELISSDDWMTLVLSHELTHVIHLDKTRGTPAGMQDLFGRHPWLFPGRMQPTWGIEGLAVYWESTVNRQGRGGAPWFEMLMRMEVANGLKPLSRINGPASEWPRNQAYLYGSYFYLFLADVYGEKTVFRLVREYSDNLVPYRLISNSARVTGKPLPQLWQQFEGWLRQRFEPQIASLRQQGLSPYTDITLRGFAHEGPVTDVDGALWFVASDGHMAPTVVRQQNGDRERIAEVQAGARLSLHPQRGLLVAQPERCDAFSAYYDLFTLTTNTRKLKRLTHCGRYRLAVWSPDGSEIAAVQHVAGKPSLVLLDADGKPKQTLLSGADTDIISSLDWHGDTIAIIQQHDTQWDIRTFNTATKTWSRLTHDRAIERSLRFDRDGSLLYSADYSGNFEIYRLANDGLRATRLTRSMGAAISPTGSDAAGNFYYVSFAADGQHIYQGRNLALENIALADTATPAKNTNGGDDSVSNPSPADIGPASDAPISDYDGWKSIAPTSWQPFWQTGDGIYAYGATVFGQDALALHQYELSLARESDLSEFLGTVSYGFADQLFVSARRDAESVATRNRNTDRYKTEFESQLLYLYPFGTLQHQWRAGGGFNLETDKLKSRDGTLAQIEENVAALMVDYSSVKYFPLLYGASSGRSMSVVLESYDAIHNSDFTGEVLSLDWHEYIPVGDNTLALRWVEGVGSEQPAAFELGGVFSEFEGLAPYVNQRKYSLRGYASQDTLTDRHLRLGTVEWRMPLRNVNRSWMAPPVGIGRSALVLFGESGSAWHSGGNPDRYYSAAGIEVIGELVLGYNLVLDTRIGIAKGFADIGESQFYMRFGRAF